MDVAADLPPDKVQVLTKRLLAEQERRITENRLGHYKPYPKQAEFHAAGATHRERLLMAGNQLGKTLAGGFEVAMHATGRIQIGGRENALTARWWRGHAVQLGRRPAIPCSVS